MKEVVSVLKNSQTKRRQQTKSFKGKDRHTGVKELAKEHTEVQQCSGEQRGDEPWVCLAARHRPGLSSAQDSVQVHDFA